MSETTFKLPFAPRRSMGLNLLLVCALALIMSIPALFVFMLLGDRTHRAEQVVAEVGGLMGGPQTFLGPVLAVPYTTPPARTGDAAEHGVFVVFPVEGVARIASKSEVRRRSLFKVPVYRADIDFRARFDLTGVAARAPAGAVVDWPRAELVVGASDARGAQSDIAFTVAGKALAVGPATTLSESALNSDDDANSHTPEGASQLKFFGAPTPWITPDVKFETDARMTFSGAQRLAVLAFAKSTSLSVSGDWRSPSFDGGFLPNEHDVGSKGFTASWKVPFIARGVAAQGGSGLIATLGRAALGVSFVEPANPYQSVARSLKYALMFVGLVFLTFSLFEATQSRRMHPAQYVLVGLTQVIFYLLLLSIAERTGFDLAFLVSATATVGLISAYAGWVFQSRRQGFIALAIFSALYILIYVLMRLEDLALLIGAIVSFVAIATAMYVTRRLDWYGAPATPGPQPVSASKDAS